MRTIGLLAVLAIGVGCADVQPGDMDGTGGSAGQTGVGGAAGTGGSAAACDKTCLADAAWRKYVAAVADVTAATAAYASAYQTALVAAEMIVRARCGYPVPTTCMYSGTENSMAMAATSAQWDAVISAEATRDALYNAYYQDAVAAGQTPMAKLQ